MKLEKRLIVTSTVSIIIQFILIIFSSYYTYKSHIETQIEFLLSEENKRFEWIIEDKVEYILSTFSTISRIIESDLNYEKSQLDLNSYIFGQKKQILYYIIEDGNSPIYSIERKPITNNQAKDEELYNNIHKKILEKKFDEHLEIIELKGKLWIELIKTIEKPENGYSHIALIHPLDFIIEYMDASHMGKGGWHALYNNDVLIHHNGSALRHDIPRDKVALKNKNANDSLYKESSFLTLDYIVGWKPGILLDIFGSTLYVGLALCLLIIAISNFILINHIDKFIVLPIENVITQLKSSRINIRSISIPKNMNRELRELLLLMVNFNNKLSRQKRKIKDIAYFDSLTKLRNRVFFEKYLKDIFSKDCEVTSGFLLFIDLDEFKIFNDTLGHEFGDRVLQETAKKLHSVMMENKYIFENGEHVLCRFGGDEFAIFVRTQNTSFKPSNLASDIIHEFRNPSLIDNHKVVINLSVGIATTSNNIIDYKDLMKKADIAMYDAKKDGKNTYRFYNIDTNVKINEMFLVREMLREAIPNNELDVYYQPQVSISSNKIIGLEALLRWNSNKYGKIPPERFIPIAEESELILDIGKWIILKVIEDIKHIDSLSERKVIISINISPIQLNKGNVLGLIKKVSGNSNFDLDRIKLEITESAIIAGSNATDQIRKLNEAGVQLSLDDFGTGFSSLSMIKDTPISELKIDQTFVKGIENGPKGKALVKTIVDLADNLGIHTVAEGVENKIQLEYLKSIGVDIIQGFYLFKPMSIQELTEKLKDND
ncbi:Phytochrome-like protein cph2 [Vibrio thalassae]|uniref:Phytochrome-like protein cph2 n=1 Tax=Vibrio thalassae TaxID=1243014 RepID=A0A240EFJ6_9VIBR|nr:GGDEF domain-containing phosphodiesterase [Vibrio thalassae]SNX47454.1 Phytochrome-like protein cph2 [Vibrio thalassae]